jgi:hypothetical protein
LNEEKLCQLLANQTRALLKKQSQAASHVHHLQIRPPQRLASQRVPVTAAQVQTSSHVKMVAEVARNSVQLQLMHHVLHAQRVRSSKSVLQSNTVIQVVRHMGTAMIALRKAVTTGFQVMSVATLKTVVDTRVVQSVQVMVATIVRHALVTAIHVLHMATAMTAAHVVETVQLMVAQVQQQVVATVAK